MLSPSNPPNPSRRDWLRASACGFGYLALANLLAEQRAWSAPSTAKLQRTQQAKRMIFVFLQGAPSQVDTFDYKPRLQKDDGKPVDGGSSGLPLLGSPWKFAQHGECGHWITELLPALATHADKLCLLKSLTTDLPNHPQAVLQMHTGAFRFARPSLGSWVLYGLGTENAELPGYLVFKPVNSRVGGPQNYGNSFLPARYQATRIGIEGQPVTTAQIAHATNPQWDLSAQRQQIDLLKELDQARPRHTRNEADLEGVIESCELAFRMQNALPRLLDLRSETQESLDLYGIGKEPTDDFGRQCLLARRAVEAGVRFVEVTNIGWDHHKNLREGMIQNTSEIDRPVAALLTDLERRGLLKETVVVLGGEFGRTPTAQNTDGRDHQANGFTMCLAGAGVKGGMSYGATDEYGGKVVENKLHIHDLNATLLHLMGLNHEQLTYRYSGRDFRLTDVYGQVIKDILV